MAAEYDIIIVGGGPRGLSAASSIVRQDHKTLLLDSGKYRNGSVTMKFVEVNAIKQIDGKFEASTNNGQKWIGKKVILATGVKDVFPGIPGYADCWISGIFHCLYCHGWEEKGIESAGMLAKGDTGAVVPALLFARQALRMAKQVTLYTDRNEQLGQDLEAALAAAPAPMVVNSKKIAELVKLPDRSKSMVKLADGSSNTEGFLAHKPTTKLRGDLAQQLGVEITPFNTIKVFPPFNQTTALSGGICTGGGAPLQI
ncbi:FAD/NAD(P)-binding domain-containing protein [Xylariaceae sp. FL1272]|nr:FAD/NAD(P)-binding domain-containing protein [Xylariaceae sp. FL1272]